MGFEDRTFHLVLEILVLLIVPYMFWLAFNLRLKIRDKWILFTIALGNLIIDVYAVLNWFIEPLFPKQFFHQFTEFLAMPAGIYMIWLGSKQERSFHKLFLIGFGILSFTIDGYLLFFTW